MIQLFRMSVPEIRESLGEIYEILVGDIGIGEGNIVYLKYLLGHKTIINTAVNLGKEVGFLNEKDSLTTLGLRVLKADEKDLRRKSFESFKEYKALLDKVEVEDSKEETPEVSIVGLAFLLESLKSYFEIDIYTLLDVEVQYMDFSQEPKKMIQFIEGLKAEGISIDLVSKYYEGRTSFEETEKIKEFLDGFKIKSL